MNYRQQKYESATGALSWEIDTRDDSNLKRICLKFDAAPTTAENITITIKPAAGTAYDTVRKIEDPIGKINVIFEDIEGLVNGDKILVTYANTDDNTISGVANYEL